MKQYIDKTALVAEIKRILSIYTKRYNEIAKYEVWITAKEIEHRIQGLKESLSILDTIEVKDTDAFIEKAWDWIEDNIMSTNQRDESLLYFEQFRNYMKGE